MNINLTIRLLSSDDLPGLVEIHIQSFQGSRSTNLGKPFLRKMYRWYLVYQRNLSLVAILDIKMVGFVTGSIGGSSRKIFRYAFWEILWGFIRRPRLLLQAYMYELWRSYLMGLLPRYKSTPQPVKPFQGYVKAALDSIAVQPNVRGKKVGQALVLAFEASAKKQGATFLSLGVEYNNDPARKLYERCGWQLARENHKNNSANYIKKIE